MEEAKTDQSVIFGAELSGAREMVGDALRECNMLAGELPQHAERIYKVRDTLAAVTKLWLLVIKRLTAINAVMSIPFKSDIATSKHGENVDTNSSDTMA